MQGYDRYLDEPEQAHEPLYCPCGNRVDRESIQMGYDTCTRCRTEDVYCSRCGESLTAADISAGDGYCGVCRERKERAGRVSA